MRKVWKNLLLFFWLVVGLPLACRAAEIKESELYARSACLMDADSGRILIWKRGSKPASHGKHNEDYDLYSGVGAWSCR